MSDLPANGDRPAMWAVAILSVSSLSAIVAVVLLGLDLVL